MARLHARLCKYGAYISLEGYGSTIELYPHFKSLALALTPAFTGRLQRAQPCPRSLPQDDRLIQEMHREEGSHAAD